LHADEEVVLVLDQEDDDGLVEAVFLGSHGMGWVGEHARLENGSQVLRVHPILVRFGGKHGK
jgi:hypothetical protein